MLTMHSSAQRLARARGAFRRLEPGGRYGTHELGLVPEYLHLCAVMLVARRPRR